MNLRRFFFSLLCAASLTLVAASSADTVILGEHRVQKGETLFCLGRGYGVYPPAIAETNGLRRTALLKPGQVLKIPAVKWESIPPGPVCPAQFKSPYSTPTPTQTPTPTAVPSSGCVQSNYVVKRGETLFRLGRRFGVTVGAIQAANGLTGTLILAGQSLKIPCETTSTPPPGCNIKGNISFETGEKIYHVPGGQFYEATVINPAFGERWFCTEADAIANGWRKSQK